MLINYAIKIFNFSKLNVIIAKTKLLSQKED